MQKLTHDACPGLCNSRGSALIIAVVLAVLMAIAGIGFLLVTTNSINNDSDAYTRDKGLNAAEAGAMLAAKYIMDRIPGDWPTANPFIYRNINGLYVKVTTTKIGNNIDSISSEAYTSSSTQDATTFVKRVIIKIQHDGL